MEKPSEILGEIVQELREKRLAGMSIGQLVEHFHQRGMSVFALNQHFREAFAVSHTANLNMIKKGENGLPLSELLEEIIAPQVDANIEQWRSAPPFPDLMRRRDREAFKTVARASGNVLIVCAANGSDLSQGYQIHGVYKQPSGVNAWTGNEGEKIRGELNRKMGAELVRSGPLDQWVERLALPENDPARGPRPPVLVFLPDGRVDVRMDAKSMELLYRYLKIDWDELYPGAQKQEPIMPEPFSEQDRAQLLATRQRALEGFERKMDEAEAQPLWSEQEQKAAEEARAHLRILEKVEAEYFQRLPRIPISRCPLCDKPLVRTFDRFGLDGPWWRSDASPQEVATCPHLCFLKGALNLNGRRARGADFEAHVGPEVPYVIPQVLSKPGVVAVLSQVDMTPGYIAYVIAYFAERRPPAADLASNWPKTFYTYTTGMGAHRWQYETQPWDFELGSWLEQKKIRWCRPGDMGALVEGPASACPYTKIKGKRERMVVQRDQAWAAEVMP